MKLSNYWNFKVFCKHLAMLFLFAIVVFCISACSDKAEQGEKDIPIEQVVISFPLSAEECVGMDTDSLETTLSAAGFSNISIETIEDLTSAEAEKLGQVQAIEVGESTAFLKGQEFEEDIEIVIYRRDFKQCNVEVKVEFIPNLLFNKYDVEVLFDNELIGTMEHGVDGNFECSAYPGEYTVLFDSASTTACGETTLSIAWDTEVSYRITCWGDEIVVTLLYIDENVALTEGEIKLDKSANEYVSKNYQSVASAFEKMGFTNVKCTPLYDIIWGITDEGEIEKVTIGGSTEYVRGDIFTKDTPVVITYHMPIEDDPTRIAVLEDSDSYKGKNYIDVENEFRKLGFLNVKFDTVTTENTSYENGQVYRVEIRGSSFEKGDTFPPTSTVTICYYNVELPVERETITVDNNSDFAEMMKMTNTTDVVTIREFVYDHIGDVIEFDGCIAFVMNHEDYKTRFDVCIAGGNYDSERVYGPLFVFEDVNFYEMNVSGADTVTGGMDFRITAEIVGVNGDGPYIRLEPVSLVAR